MNKYHGLLAAVSQRYNIDRGTHETENEWKTRLIYSICGMMAYASLWDGLDEEPVSIVHVKRKVHHILAGYKSLYPELSGSLPSHSEELEEEIANLFLRAGVVYHRPNRIVPSMKREEPCNPVLFQRGIALDDISCVSGIGFYAMQNQAVNTDGVKAMFGLAQEKLRDVWSTVLAAASWKTDLTFTRDTEYLRLKPPFTRGYWVNRPDTAGTVSMLRTGMSGSWLYYLYRYSGAVMEVSPLPQWQVDGHSYRLLACACLASYGTLPPIQYTEDGALVHLQMNYLLPPRELEFLKFYSWPETCISLPCDFKRKLSVEVFTAMKNLLSEEGYAFAGGTI